MDIIILDKFFLPLAPINSLQTLIWDRRAKEPGMFEVHCGASDFEAIEGGAYVYRKDRDELGVIQEADLGRDAAGARTCYAKGYFAENMLFDRVVDVTENLSGTPEEICRKLVDKYFVNASGYEGRSVSNIVLGVVSGEVMEKTKTQVTGNPVGTAIAGIEEPHDLMHRLSFDGATGTLSFSMHKGYDRGAIFSDEYSNIRSASYHRDSSDAPNVVFVAGAGEGADRKRIMIDLRSDQKDYAREMYVDARDLQQSWEEDGVTKYYTDEDYAILLENRGMAKVAGHKVLENFQVDADPTANLVYREDYDVGDWCTVRVTVHGYLKFELVRQITAIKETYEAGKMSIAITFGDYGPRSLNEYVARTVSVNEVVPSVAAGGGEDLSKLTTNDKSSLVGAVNEVDGDAGDLSRLTTKHKETLVDAINEVDGDVGDTEELHTETTTSVVEAVNEVADKIGDLNDLETSDKSSIVAAINEAAKSGGGSGGEDARIGDMTKLKTSHKDTVVNAVNDVFAMAVPKNMGIVIAECAPSNVSGLTVANFWGTQEIDASAAYSVNTAVVTGSAPADGGGVSFGAAIASNFYKQVSKKVTLVYGCPLYGFPEGTKIKVGSVTYYAPRSLRGGNVIVDLTITVSGSNYDVRLDIPVDFVSGTGLTIDGSAYVGFVPKAVGSPAGVTNDMEGFGPEGSITGFNYVPFVPVAPVSAGTRLITGIAAAEAVFQISRTEYVAAMFTPSVATYATHRFVTSLRFAGWASVEHQSGTTGMTFKSWLSTNHK